MARLFHFCQACKKEVSPSINDDTLKEYDQVAMYYRYVDAYWANFILSYRCPKCKAPWKPVLLYVGRPRKYISFSTRFGKGNYKKKQQARGRAKTPSQPPYLLC